METAVIEKFWKGVVKGEKSWECWGWIGTLDKTGLPTIRLGNSRSRDVQREYYPRQITLELAGITVIPGKRVVSICRNKLCLNPEHLANGDAARFWKHVQKLSDDCWVWTGPLSGDGVGEFTVEGQVVMAHRYSWKLWLGRMPPEQATLSHSCGNLRCVNPHHLVL